MTTEFRPISATLGADALRQFEGLRRKEGNQPPRFITIARQAWAGGSSMMHRLVDRLNAADPGFGGTPGWRGFDRELIEHVARQHGLHAAQLEGLEDRPYSFVDDLLRGFATEATPTELTLAKRISRTIYDLARAGRAVIVGRGGVFVTHRLTGGVHLYLVAPLEDRVKRLMAARDLSASEAENQVREIDRNRIAFYGRHFPDVPFTPDLFTLTLNTARLDDDAMTDVVLRLVLAGIPAGVHV